MKALLLIEVSLEEKGNGCGSDDEVGASYRRLEYPDWGPAVTGELVGVEFRE